MKLSQPSLADLNWWYDHVSHVSAPIVRETPNVELTTDASGIGWGAVLNDISTGGHWSIQELQHGVNINFLELHAVLLGLKCFVNQIKGKAIKVNIDNSTAVACINNFGSTHSEVCNSETREIWNFASENDIWLIAAHLPGKLNVIADKESRTVRDETEWMLNDNLFKKLTDVYFIPTIDLFASRLNFQLQKYVSWKPDPEAIAIDAFTICWTCELFYCYSTFQHNTSSDTENSDRQSRGVDRSAILADTVLVPSVNETVPTKMKVNKSSLILKHKLKETHPLYKKLTLLACHVSGKVLRSKIYPAEQFKLL